MGAPHYTVALQKVAAEQGLTILHAAERLRHARDPHGGRQPPGPAAGRVLQLL